MKVNFHKITGTVASWFLFYFWLVEDQQHVAQKLLDIWLHMKKIDKMEQYLPKSKQPTSKSYVNLCTAVIDPFTPPKFLLLHDQSISKNNLTIYQTKPNGAFYL